MRVKLLLVAEIEVSEESEPESAALSRIQSLAEAEGIDIYPPAIGRITETAGSKSAEAFY